MRLVLSTRNDGKAREFGSLMAPHIVDPLPKHVMLPPETGETFAENALEKARTAARELGRPAIADDSGIAAEALDGRPGVRSARYAGENATDEQNLDKLMREAPAGSRLAYVCALAYVAPDGTEHVVEGRCEGTLSDAKRGNGGFGYDPAFIPDEHPTMTMAELTPEDKDAISHRGKAARALLAWLPPA